MKLNTHLFTFLFFFSSSVLAQPAIQWQWAYGGDEHETPSGIVQTSDGGFLVIGTTGSDDGDVSGKHRHNDIWALKLNATGGITWQKCLGGDSVDISGAVALTSDGGYLVGGSTLSINGDVKNNDGDFDAWLVKLDASGNIVWEKTYGAPGPGWERCSQIIPAADGGYVFVGSSHGSGGDIATGLGGDDIWVVKVNDTGKILWEKTMGGSGLDAGYGIVETHDKGFVVVGTSYIPATRVDAYVGKLNAAGSLVWQKRYGGSRTDDARAVCKAGIGGFVFVGHTNSPDGDITDMPDSTDRWVVHIDDTGKILMQTCVGGSLAEEGNSVLETPEGHYVVAGTGASSDGDLPDLHGTYADMWLTAHYQDGSFRWRKAVGGTKNDAATKIIRTGDGGYAVLGTTTSNDGDAAGNNYHGIGSFDIWVVKMGSTASVNDLTQDPRIKVYPTPATDKLYISLPADFRDAKFSLWNITGQSISLFGSLQGTAGAMSVTDYPAGNYMLQIRSGDKVSSHKILIEH